MFKTIRHIDDIRPHVSDKTEIRFLQHQNGVTIGCYMFMDSKTFDSPEALECRGIAFDADGLIISRPLHKFFNIGEKEWLAPERMLERDDIAAVYEKLDGSMIATAWIDGALAWRSKKSFESDVVKLAMAFLDTPDGLGIKAFAHDVASRGMTAIFELTHPDARIVVAQDRPALRLLHVRDNQSGEYVMLNAGHVIHWLIERYRVPLVRRHDGMSLSDAMSSLDDMQECEGYVVQFKNGDMVKIKCPWYRRLHRSITFLRERDIATLALNEELDDVKGALVEAGIDLSGVNAVEARLKSVLSDLLDEIKTVYQAGKGMDRKSFAVANKNHPMFGLVMHRYSGNEVPLLDWYIRNRLKDDFSLRALTDRSVEDV